MNSTLTDDSEPVLLHVVYANELRIHAVTLIWMGHQRLDGSSLATAEEDTITGSLIIAMKQVAQDPTSAEWVDRYEIHEQVRQNVEGKQGKSRPIMDIEIECHRRGPRPRLGFEAKRLGRGSGVSDYLGEEGMTAFLTGYYPTTHGDAGMLGYVQTHSPTEWSTRLATELRQKSKRHRVAADGGWKAMTEDSVSVWYSSQHMDSNNKAPCRSRLAAVSLMAMFDPIHRIVVGRSDCDDNHEATSVDDVIGVKNDHDGPAPAPLDSRDS